MQRQKWDKFVSLHRQIVQLYKSFFILLKSTQTFICVCVYYFVINNKSDEVKHALKIT